MVFPIELVLPIDGRDAGEVLGEGDVPEFVAEAWVRAGLARRPGPLDHQLHRMS